jgi:Tol biopolymer transport system component
VRLTQHHFYQSPTWSPDGKRIAFVGTASIYVIDPDGGNQIQLPKTAPKPYFPSSASWSPEGSEILIWGFESFRDDSGLAKSRATIRAISALGGDGKGRLIGRGVDPVWSPDGSKIVFVRRGQIYVMNADGRNQIRLTDLGDNMQPAWEPIAFRSQFETPTQRWPAAIKIVT